ncbi:aldo/keto reductase [Nonomuraea sp. NPDC052129]|uniref:aldo/keto reductase n=1 Tax=Nonomuraea sp. NPDC052129 TaxID=3154651 RepID=UPI00342F082B
MATVALAWLTQQPTVTAPVASARTVEQLPALFAAQDLHLSDAELQTLTAVSS